MMKLGFISLIVLVLNIPFGYWRANVRKFSWQWILSIHIPVVVIIAIRLLSHLGFAWYTYVFIVSAFFLGQQTGNYLMKRNRRVLVQVTSCLVMDLFSLARH
jgi:uncharacterized membrane protein YhaH (DUF805 family)